MTGIHELYVEGDIACAHADFAALAAIAERLIEGAKEPLHCELASLARACVDPGRATDAWNRIKETLEAPR